MAMNETLTNLNVSKELLELTEQPLKTMREALQRYIQRDEKAEV
jgi:hypothetical protein